MSTTLPEPEVICTHEADLDGLVSGLLLQQLANHLFGKDVPLEAYHYNIWRNRQLKEKSGWVCDLSMEAKMDKAGWMVVDHHTTDVVPKSALFRHDLKKSASLLCYELCKEHGMGSPELDRLVHLSNVADLFLEDEADFVIANDYANLVKTYQFWNVHALIEGKLERLIDHPLLEVMAVKRRIEDPLGLEWSRANIEEISPTVGLVNTVVGNINLIVHQLLEQKASKYPVLVTLFRRSNALVIVSLRSKDGSALKVAQQLQGGGHANACGATLPRSVTTTDDGITYLKKTLNTSATTHQPPALNSLDSLLDGIQLPGNK